MPCSRHMVLKFTRARQSRPPPTHADGKGLHWLRTTARVVAARSMSPPGVADAVTRCFRKGLSTLTVEILQVQALLPYLLPNATAPLNACLLDSGTEHLSPPCMTSATVHRCVAEAISCRGRCSVAVLFSFSPSIHWIVKCRALAAIKLSKDATSVNMAKSLLAREKQASLMGLQTIIIVRLTKKHESAFQCSLSGRPAG